MSNTNSIDYQAREAKPPQGGPNVPIVDLFRLDRRSILITGGSGLLGLAVAGAILESGADVILLDRTASVPQNAWDTLQAKAQATSCRVSYYSCDTTDADRVQAVFEEFVPMLRHPLRGLVACAGISDGCPAVEYPVDSFRRILDVNVTGTFLVAQACARELQKQAMSGSMVLVASMSGTVVNKGVDTSAYNASKSAVLQLARSLAAEWGSRVYMPLIRVNTLSPGYIRTAATAETLAKPGFENLWTSDNMLNRLSTPDEFRGPVVYMLSDASSFMTAADLRVDGGHCAW